MTPYARRHAWMGALAMLVLTAVGMARHASPSYYVLLSAIGALQAAVVRALSRRLRRQGKELG